MFIGSEKYISVKLARAHAPFRGKGWVSKFVCTRSSRLISPVINCIRARPVKTGTKRQCGCNKALGIISSLNSEEEIYMTRKKKISDMHACRSIL